MSRRVHYAEGQAITSTEMNAMGTLAHKFTNALAQQILYRDLTPPTLRTFTNNNAGYSGQAHATTPTVTLTQGFFAELATNIPGAPAGDDENPYVVFVEANEAFSVSPLTVTTNVRADIVQGRFVYGSFDSVTRDFKDATTLALSSQSFDSRGDYYLELSYKEGTEVVSSPVEPTPDAGFTKFASVAIAGVGPLTIPSPTNSITDSFLTQTYQKTIDIPALYQFHSGWSTIQNPSIVTARCVSPSGSSDRCYIPLHKFHSGDIVNSIEIRVENTTSNGTMEAVLSYNTATGGSTEVQVLSQALSTGFQVFSMTGIDHTISGDRSYMLVFRFTGTPFTNTITLRTIEAVLTIPMPTKDGIS